MLRISTGCMESWDEKSVDTLRMLLTPNHMSSLWHSCCEAHPMSVIMVLFRRSKFSLSSACPSTP
jgi:hypothetical protein